MENNTETTIPSFNHLSKVPGAVSTWMLGKVFPKETIQNSTLLIHPSRGVGSRVWGSGLRAWGLTLDDLFVLTAQPSDIEQSGNLITLSPRHNSHDLSIHPSI